MCIGIYMYINHEHYNCKNNGILIDTINKDYDYCRNTVLFSVQIVIYFLL
jgi:hypothetical protein